MGGAKVQYYRREDPGTKDAEGVALVSMYHWGSGLGMWLCPP